MDILSHQYKWTPADHQRRYQAQRLALDGGFHQSQDPKFFGKEISAEVLFIGCDHYLNFGVRLEPGLKMVTPRPEAAW